MKTWRSHMMARIVRTGGMRRGMAGTIALAVVLVMAAAGGITMMGGQPSGMEEPHHHPDASRAGGRTGQVGGKIVDPTEAIVRTGRAEATGRRLMGREEGEGVSRVARAEADRVARPVARVPKWRMSTEDWTPYRSASWSWR